jgi:hypothetical protein
MTVFWDIEPCSLVKVDRRFRGAYCLHHRLMKKTVRTSETSVNIYQTTWPSISEDILKFIAVRTWNLTWFIQSSIHGLRYSKSFAHHKTTQFCFSYLPYFLSLSPAHSFSITTAQWEMRNTGQTKYRPTPSAENTILLEVVHSAFLSLAGWLVCLLSKYQRCVSSSVIRILWAGDWTNAMGLG